MNVIAPMAGICDGEFTKKFTKENVDMILLGGYNSNLETFKAGLENSKNDRQEFLTCPHHLSDDITEQIEIIREYNPSWNGIIGVNLRGTDVESFSILKNNNDMDVLEVNAHCRQEATVNCGAGETLLRNESLLSDILEEVTTHPYDISVKIRANVDCVNTISIVELIESYDVKYIHVDAMKPGIMSADYDIINKISKITSKHLIGNNSVTSHEDYEKMLESGADSVSVARATLEGSVSHIFNG
ncbi:MAG: tRNA-dihydrouridine synthase [Methanosphaera sp.]|nr:tRNA-dihydrouridine synthase [Methanosphaera sp.]